MNRLILGVAVTILVLSTIPDGARNIVSSASLGVVINFTVLIFLLVGFNKRHFSRVCLGILPIWLCLIFWLIVTFFQTFEFFGYVNYHPAESMSELNLYLSYCGYLFLMTCLLDDSRKINFLFLTLLLLCLGQTIFGLLNYYSGENPLGWRPTHWAALRVTGTYVNRNLFSNLLVQCLGIALIPLLVKSNRNSVKFDSYEVASKTTFYWLSVFILAGGIILSGSRGGVLSLIIASGFSLVLILLTGKFKLRLKYVFGSILAVFVLFGSELFQSRFSRHLLDIREKVDQWWSTAELISAKWILGYGPGSYEEAYRSNIPFQASPLTHNHAHSDVLELLVEQGLFGALPLMLFICLIYYFGIKKLLSSKNSTRVHTITIAIFGITGMVSHGFYDFPFQSPANVLVFLTLVAILLSSLNYKSRAYVG
jgi:O-antigen ligase